MQMTARDGSESVSKNKFAVFHDQLNQFYLFFFILSLYFILLRVVKSVKCRSIFMELNSRLGVESHKEILRR